jgi:Uma2 family endonuclease
MTPTTLVPEANLQRVSRRGEPTWELACLYPLQGEWTEQDYLAVATNRLVELSDGCLEFPPMPTIFHQLIVQFLFKLLDGFVAERALGQVLLAPLPVRLWPGKYREPDILYLGAERMQDVRKYPHGADLVMEVISGDPKDRERDLKTKREEYAQAKIAEYWIIDAEAYRIHGIFSPGAKATSVLLSGFSVAVADLFAAGELSSERR